MLRTTLCDPMDCSPSGSSVPGISQARILEWVAIFFSRRSFWPRDGTCVSCIASGFFTAEPLGKPLNCPYLFLNPIWAEVPRNPYQVHAQLAFCLQKEALPGLHSSWHLPVQEKRTLPNRSDSKAWNLRMVRARGRGDGCVPWFPTSRSERICFLGLENGSGFIEQVSPFLRLIMSWFWRAEGREGREGQWGSNRGLEPWPLPELQGH